MTMPEDALPDWLMEIMRCLRCPDQPLQQGPEGLVCTVCGRVYEVRDGIAVMLPDPGERREGIEDTADPRTES